MMKINAKLFALSILVITLSGCGGGGGDNNTPPVSTGKWTWVSGSNTVDQAGTYGTQGTAAPANVPGARYEAVSWVDSSGKLWLFGGNGTDSAGNGGWLNDLWKYDPATLEWTWISGSSTSNQLGTYGTQGTADPSNVPGARYRGVSWIDSSGNLWLFGGVYYSTPMYGFVFNDLWKYDPATNEWTWVSGSQIGGQAGTYGTQGTADPANVPGARHRAVSWIDSSSNLWLFGGVGFDSAGNYGYLNDLWKYDPATDEWTWVSGSQIGSQAGTYGTKGTADPSIVPGARYEAVSWLDSSGKLWLFGGTGYGDSASYSGYLNDLWDYDLTTLEWTWVSGSSSTGQAGTYGTQGTAAPANVPGARGSAVSWIDSSGKLWLFGGAGYDPTAPIYSNYFNINDLWKYDPTTLEWTWVSGSSTRNQAGTYGTKGTAASSNVPGARSNAISWIDSSGKLWLFGGAGFDSAGNTGSLNDLWHYSR
jgi:N-acetylneuraminic acid mutarotase